MTELDYYDKNKLDWICPRCGEELAEFHGCVRCENCGHTHCNGG
jgi:DNA-directed RNA polymerase subunit RPC12/RpoP